MTGEGRPTPRHGRSHRHTLGRPAPVLVSVAFVLAGLVAPAGSPSASAKDDRSTTELGFTRRSWVLPRTPPTAADVRAGLAAARSSTFGPVTGAETAITGVDTWHAAGQRGQGVKIGIVDVFDLGLWNPAEHGPRPDAAHTFCLDTSGEGASACPMPVDGLNNGDSQEHGVAVAEVLKDVAPDAELYIATVGTTADLDAAITWFASNGVTIVTRSLESPWDGPGDGTGPLDAVVDHAAALGITWFNSAGNDAAGSYGRFTDGVTSNGYVDFDNGPGVSTSLNIHGACVGFEGIRWANDWGKPGRRISRYSIEISSQFNPTIVVDQRSSGVDAPPLMLAGQAGCTLTNVVIRMRRIDDGGDPSPDTIEIGLFAGQLDASRSSASHSATSPVVDSRNPALLAVGAVDPAAGTTIAPYSSQGPTNDGRVKPDVSAPSCVASTIYNPAVYGPGACFNGTSAASPIAAGLAAVLLGRGLAVPGVPLAALVRHLVVDLGPAGPDDVYGTGEVHLPAPPPASIDGRPATYRPLDAPRRILDTRAASPTPGARIGPFAPRDIVDVPIPDVGATGPITAVAISVVSVGSVEANFVQVLPTLAGQLGGFANVNVTSPGRITPNFAIVPVGAGGSISIYLPTGGDVVVDLMGWFGPADAAAVTAGRFVPVPPTRALDTRPDAAGPVPAGWVPHRPASGESVVVPRPASVPADAAALVLNVTATDAVGAGFLRVQPTGATGLATANGNYVAGSDSGTMSIVPVGPDGTVSVFTSNSAHVVADVTGYITSATGPSSGAGLFVPVAPNRQLDTRSGGGPVLGGSTLAIALALGGGATAVSVNLAADEAATPGFVTAFPADGPLPLVSNLNFPAGAPLSNAAMLPVSPGGRLKIFANVTAHVIIDVNGYFTGTS